MKYLALLAVFFAAPLFGQCTLSPDGVGTVCTGPLKVTAPVGGSPTGAQEFIPATAQNPCLPGIAVRDGTYAMCGSAGAIVVDFGDGKGYVSMKGDPGPSGQSIVGPKGDTGSQGVPGPPGLQGKTGNTGAAGPQGFQGRTGNTGATGPQGIPGQKGDSGATGPTGPQGVSGQAIVGPIGPVGPVGPPGTFPKTFTCDVAQAALGGTGVPHFKVTQLVLTNCK